MRVCGFVMRQPQRITEDTIMVGRFIKVNRLYYKTQAIKHIQRVNHLAAKKALGLAAAQVFLEDNDRKENNT